MKPPKSALSPGSTNSEPPQQSQEPASAASDLRLPKLLTLGIVRRQNAFHAVVLETQGLKVLREKILESSPYESVAIERVLVTIDMMHSVGLEVFP